MSMIKIENLTFCYPACGENVFENLNAVIDTEWKLALVGRNGRGKTTLLKLLHGEYEYGGKITGGVRFDYFPYAVKDKNKSVADILSEICPERYEWEFIKELSSLGMDADVLYMPFEYLSSGEQTKILLAAMFLKENNFLLIDEPTNHLDAAAREQVANYLGKKKGFIVVSHDRDFLDGCVDHVMALNRTDIEIRGGTFGEWLDDFENRQLAEQEQKDKLHKEIKRLKQSAAQSADWARKTEAGKKGSGKGDSPPDRGFIGHKAAKMMKRSKILEGRQKRLIEEKSSLLRNVETSDALKIAPLKYRSEKLVVFDKVQIVYDGVAINEPVSFTVNRGRRIALSGGNGCGKSSLLKPLVGREVEHTGQIHIGSGLIVSYVPQAVSALSGNIKEMLMCDGIDVGLFMAVLCRMGVEENPLGKDMSELSDGQKKKVLIAKSLCESAHVYIWDEPLNYIDIYCRIQIEKLIKEFGPTMIFIEHDRSFRNAVATEIVEL
ncbi:MAG: ABC-F type ribosomal protection protein [Clostridia bacterium]|nr:ABC-F type ribosomal protection protein [Clostridia bacterium]